MIRYTGLYEKIISPENLSRAYDKARKGKAWQRKIRLADKHREENLAKLHEVLKHGEYHTSAYRNKMVYEPKKRQIWILPFYPDRVVHHAIANVLMPIWTSTFIQDTYSCIEGRGQHRGSKRCMEFVQKYPYVLQCDVSKFYPSIDHTILNEILRRKIKDERLMNLLNEIIQSAPGCPIGNYLSQPFGNLYLNELDHIIKQKYRIHGYIRYCDDFLLFGTKEELNRMKPVVKEWIEGRKLRLSKMNLYPTKCGVDFLGYRHFPGGKLLVRKRTAKRMRRRVKKILPKLKTGRISKDTARSMLASVNGWLCHAQSHHLRQAMDMDKLVEAVEAYA